MIYKIFSAVIASSYYLNGYIPFYFMQVNERRLIFVLIALTSVILAQDIRHPFANQVVSLL